MSGKLTIEQIAKRQRQIDALWEEFEEEKWRIGTELCDADRVYYEQFPDADFDRWPDDYYDDPRIVELTEEYYRKEDAIIENFSHN